MKTEKTNEEIVAAIRANIDVTANYELLFEQNQYIIKKIVKPYAVSSGNDIDDLVQESFFALIKAVEHYESSENVQFMSYATYWIKQTARNYVVKSGLLSVPSSVNAKVQMYKIFISNYERDYGRLPDDETVITELHLTMNALSILKSLAQGISSLDVPIATDADITIADTLQADFNVANDAVEQIMDERKREELLSTVSRYTNEKQNAILYDFYFNGYRLSEIARRHCVSVELVAQIKRDGLNKLRRGRARKELIERFEILDARAYHGTLSSFKRTFTSTVERTVIERLDAEQQHERTIEHLEQ